MAAPPAAAEYATGGSAAARMAAEVLAEAEEYERAGGGVGEAQRDGFRTETELLHWALNASDADALAQAAELADAADAAGAGYAHRKTLEEQRADVAAMLEASAVKPDAELIGEAVDVLRSTGSKRASVDEQLAALAALQYLVEPIDNANDLEGLGGVAVLQDVLVDGVSAGEDADPRVLAAAAWALGTACSNNAKFQEALLDRHPAALGACLDVVAGSMRGADEGGAARAKALYALGACARENEVALASLLAAGMVDTLAASLRHGGSEKVSSKALVLLTDTARFVSPRAFRSTVDAQARAATMDAVAAVLEGAPCGEKMDLAERGLLAAEALAAVEEGGAKGGAAMAAAAGRARRAARATAECAATLAGADADLVADLARVAAAAEERLAAL